MSCRARFTTYLRQSAGCRAPQGQGNYRTEQQGGHTARSTSVEAAAEVDTLLSAHLLLVLAGVALGLAAHGHSVAHKARAALAHAAWPAAGGAGELLVGSGGRGGGGGGNTGAGGACDRRRSQK